MRQASDNVKCLSCPSTIFCLSLGAFSWLATAWGSQPSNGLEVREQPSAKSELNLRAIPFKIIYETYRRTSGRINWELYLINADGFNAINLTQTPDVDEMYPHASPDGTKVCFVADEGTGRNKVLLHEY
jgi:hypothetical protein